MNHRVRLLCLLLCLLFSGAVASAQSSIPTSVKSAADAEPHRSTIRAFINAQAKRIASGKPSDVRAGREAIETQAAAANPTPSFLDVYAEELDRAMVALAKSKNLLVRLNAAIANARVAERVKNWRLQGGTLLFLNDPVDAVALWGAKAARSVIPHILNLGGGAVPDRLSPALVNAVKRHPKVGAIAEEAYNALALRISPADEQAVVQAVAPHVLDILDYRVGLYSKGVPSLASVDTMASQFLSQAAVWKNQPEAQQTRIVQLIADLISLAAQQGLSLEPAQRRPLLEVIDRAAGALQVIGERSRDQTLIDVGKSLRGIGPGSEESLNRAMEVHDRINQGEKYKLNPPPEIVGSEVAEDEEVIEEGEGEGEDEDADPDAETGAPEEDDDAVLDADDTEAEPAPARRR